MIVREATLSDLGPVWSLCLKFHREFASSFAPLDQLKALERVTEHIDTKPGFVAERDGQIGGVLLLDVFRFWYSTRMCLGDLLFYVAPEFRGSSAAPKLIRAGRNLARECHAQFMIRVSSGQAGDKVDRFYGRCGLRKIGAAYMMEG